MFVCVDYVYISWVNLRKGIEVIEGTDWRDETAVLDACGQTDETSRRGRRRSDARCLRRDVDGKRNLWTRTSAVCFSRLQVDGSERWSMTPSHYNVSQSDYSS